MTDIAKLALAAADAEREAAELEQQAQTTRDRAIAQREIALHGAKLGIDVDINAISEIGLGVSGAYSYELPVDDDATLVIQHLTKPVGVERDQSPTQASVRPAEQLYWNLPPGVEEKGVGGGTYGCYGLSQHSCLRPIDTLADLGRAIALVRQAREQWRYQHRGDL